jgi:hypothetical protein
MGGGLRRGTGREAFINLLLFERAGGCGVRWPTRRSDGGSGRQDQRVNGSLAPRDAWTGRQGWRPTVERVGRGGQPEGAVAAAAGGTNARLAAWRQGVHGQGDEGGGKLVSTSSAVGAGLAVIFGCARSRAWRIGEGECWLTGRM